MTFDFEQPLTLKDQILSALGKATSDMGHPWRTPVLGNQQEDAVQLRTLVLREVDESAGQLIAYTDWRSPKVSQLLKNPEASWLFYDSSNRCQLRNDTRIEILHNNDHVRETWLEKVTGANRPAYSTSKAPSSELKEGEEFLSEEQKTSPSLENCNEGENNFCIIRATITKMELLQLDPDGVHKRILLDLERGTHQRLVP